MAQNFGLEFKMKRMFFDRKEVQREVGKLNAAALSKAGAFIRRRARSSMRRRKRASAPGAPPSAHSTDPVRSLKAIWFAYDRQHQSVVIGPLKLNSGNVPALHEFGGTRPVVERFVGGKWISEGILAKRKGRGWLHSPRRVVAARYPARPFMGPALKAEIPNFPTLWAANRAGAA